MQNVKILSALMFGLVGFWAFSLVSEGEATHILINQTAAYPEADGTYILTFTLENKGDADRLTDATSPDGEITLASEVTIPNGVTLFTRDDAWLTLRTESTASELGLQLQFETSGTVSAVIRVATP